MILSAIQSAVDFIVPPRCLLCHEIIGKTGHFCGPCWRQLNFISAPQCDICGLPFDSGSEEKMVCAPCLTQTPIYTQARSVLVYDSVSKKLLLPFKHGDATYLAPALGKQMALISYEILNKTDYITPVPLHWKRLFKRRYNQAALLAQHLAKFSHSSLILNLLNRHKNTQPQGHLSKRQREENVHKVFSVNPKYATLLKGTTVTLVDDVLTSGATLNACAKALKHEGARDVYAITLARVVPGRF